MLSIAATGSRIHISLKWLIIPLLVLAALATGVGLLYSANWTALIFALVFASITMFVEPFVGALLYIIFLYMRPTEILAITRGMPLMRLLAVSAMGIWLLHVLVRRQREFVKSPQNFLMIAFLLALAVSKRIYIHGIIGVLTGDFAKIAVIYFLLVNLITTEKRLQVTIWVLILSTFWLSLHGILLSRGIVIGEIELAEAYRVQSSGIFGDPNDLAQAIVVALPLVFSLFFYERLALKKLALGVIGVTMLYSFLLTASRGGFVGLAVVIFFAVVMFFFTKRRTGIIISIMIGLVVLLIALAGILAFAPDYTTERLRTISPYEGTGAGRVELWYRGWRLFRSNPIMGVGKDNFAEFSQIRKVAHNSFIHVAAELGLLGLLIWIGLFYFSFKSLNGARKLYSPPYIPPACGGEEKSIPSARGGDIGGASRVRVLSGSLIVSMIGFVSTAFFLSRQYEYLPYILIALSAAVYQLASKERGLKLTFSIRELFNILLVTLLFFVVWVGILRVFL